MKKKWLSIVLLCSFTLVFLAGCGTNSNPQTDNDSAVVVATTEVEDTTEVSSSVQESTDNESAESADVRSDQEDSEDTSNESDEEVEYT